MKKKIFWSIGIVCFLWCCFFNSYAISAPGLLPGKARLILIFVLDGLRPDSVNPIDTPNIYRLRQQGVNCINSHSVFPTVTRVNSAAISTGAYPGKNGLVSNSMFVPAVKATGSFTTGDYNNLLKLAEVNEGRLLSVKTLAQRLHEKKLTFVAISSGSSGTSFLLNPHAPQGVGVLVSGRMVPDSLVAYPDSVNQTILSRFGSYPAEQGIHNTKQRVDWTETVLREYVLPDLQPDVVINWVTEPDHTQHSAGIGSPESIETIKNDDRHIGLILEKLKDLNLYKKTDIFIMSDHGFSRVNYQINVAEALITAGLKKNKESGDVVLASSGQSVLVHVKNKQYIQDIVRFLQAQQWVDVIFTAAKDAGDKTLMEEVDRNPLGWVDGTFSLQLIHADHKDRGADIIFTFPWSSDRNQFGYSGTDYTMTHGETKAVNSNKSGHGSMSPWTIRNTMIAWGVDFKKGVTNHLSSCNVDIVPTVLALKGLKIDEHVDGRVLSEALVNGPDGEKSDMSVQMLKVTNKSGSYKAAIQISKVDTNYYIDKSWRLE